MRHLRLFEGTTNQHYWIIPRDEYVGRFQKTNLIDFGHGAKLDRWIESQPGFRKESDDAPPHSRYDIFKPFFIGDRHYSKRGLQRKNGVMTYRLEALNQSRDEAEFIVYISESEDEWFWVRLEKFNQYSSIVYYYKCDQFDGLKKLLTDKKIFMK